ncbi:Long-chain fatty acid transport protein [hydrothermal vent metagenome]|uniref:Long-chain fatty acid transport protein n=1 Tax=hydrothermal vent metagenome TaxID=652676 RepID=A0A1W1BFX5_9ZZZZ
MQLHKKIALSILAATTLFGGGYKIPESSLDAVALSSASIAASSGADASYYNPANMAFSKDKGSTMELDLTYIGLSKVDYKGTTWVGAPVNSNVPTDTSSESENFLVPTLHYVSPAMGKMRMGFSIVSPGGLSKRWKESPASLYAKEFTLKTVEINPTVSYKLTDAIAIGGGLRALYSDGIVKNAKYDMTGDSWDFGYNVAVSVQMDKETTLALTYRSKINMTVDGTTSRTATGINSDVRVDLPIPAAFNIALSHTIKDTTIEAVIERNFWSSYKQLDFNFANSVNETNLGTPIPKLWSDSTAYRFGITHRLGRVTLMAGYAYDNTPIPESTINYELPSSDANIFSLGGKYRYNENFEFGLAALTALYKDRKVNNTKLNGEFTNSKSYLVSASVEYKF